MHKIAHDCCDIILLFNANNLSVGANMKLKHLIMSPLFICIYAITIETSAFIITHKYSQFFKDNLGDIFKGYTFDLHMSLTVIITAIYILSMIYQAIINPWRNYKKITQSEIVNLLNIIKKHDIDYLRTQHNDFATISLPTYIAFISLLLGIILNIDPNKYHSIIDGIIVLSLTPIAMATALVILLETFFKYQFKRLIEQEKYAKRDVCELFEDKIKHDSFIMKMIIYKYRNKFDITGRVFILLTVMTILIALHKFSYILN